ncbi:hypothetical protein V8B97DRAFT_1024766 [Scleroderma yunnanense]
MKLRIRRFIKACGKSCKWKPTALDTQNRSHVQLGHPQHHGGHHSPSRDPLQILPPELTHKIFLQWLSGAFDQYPPGSNPSQLPVLLCLVSKSWKDFVYTTPLLWRFIAVNLLKDRICDLKALNNRLNRTQNVSLVVHILPGYNPHIGLLQVLFAHSNRFAELSLDIFDQSWWERVRRAPFDRLEKFVVNCCDISCHSLSTIFCTAPFLHHVQWHSSVDLFPILLVHGHQLKSIDLDIKITGTDDHILDILTACPNLCSATFSRCVRNIPHAISQRKITMANLKFLNVHGAEFLPSLLENVYAPLLSALCVTVWCSDDVLASAFELFVSRSPLLVDLTIWNDLLSQDRLIAILRSHPRIARLVISTMATNFPTALLITDTMFKLLTPCQETQGGGVLLPQLEQLVVRGCVDVPDDIILDMIDSRTGSSSFLPPRAYTSLKVVMLDWCKPMSLHSINRLEQISRERGITIGGSFVNGPAIILMK